jgi:hypothetical protein
LFNFAPKKEHFLWQKDTKRGFRFQFHPSKKKNLEATVRLLDLYLQVKYRVKKITNKRLLSESTPESGQTINRNYDQLHGQMFIKLSVCASQK